MSDVGFVRTILLWKGMLSLNKKNASGVEGAL